MTCTATFNATTPINEQSDIEVRSYYGELDWMELQRGKYDTQNTEFLVDEPWKQFDINSQTQESNTFLVGQTRNIGKYATQSCGAYRMIGQIPHEALTLQYGKVSQWGEEPGLVDMKSNTEISI